MRQAKQAFSLKNPDLYLFLRENISWWLYDTDDYIVETKDGSQKWDLREPEALYDYLVEEN